VMLRGTTRAFSPTIQDLMERRMNEICAGIAAAHGTKAALRYTRAYPPTVNSEHEAGICAAVLEKLVGAKNIVKPKPVMGSEDFSFMLEKKAGCYVFAGSGTAKNGAALHNPNYDFNDALLPLGAAYWVGLAEHILSK